MKRLRGALVAGSAMFLGGCAGGPGGEEGDTAQPDSPAPEVRPAVPLTEWALLGEITYMNREGGFALIEAARDPDLEPGEKFEVRTREGAPAGELVLSPERKRGYLIGDVVSGYPQVADRVYFERELLAPAEEPEESRDQRGGSKNKDPGKRRFGGR